GTRGDDVEVDNAEGRVGIDDVERLGEGGGEAVRLGEDLLADLLVGFAAVEGAAVEAGHALDEHGGEDPVHEEERGPEVEVAETGAHVAPGDLGEAVVDPGEEAEDRAGGDDVVEVPDDVVGVVQVEVGQAEGEGQAGEAADPEHGD